MSRRAILAAAFVLTVACGRSKPTSDPAPLAAAQPPAQPPAQPATESATDSAAREDLRAPNPIASPAVAQPAAMDAHASPIRMVGPEVVSIKGVKHILVAEENPFLSRLRAERRIKNIVRSQPVMVRVHGGRKAAPDDWPWAAAFLTDFKGNGTLDLFCGGSLVAPGWVLTAAHCEVDQRAVVLVGESDLSDLSAAVGVARVCNHERYEAGGHDFDLALIKLRDTVHKAVVPLDLKNPSVTPYDATVIGWGELTQGGGYSSTLQAAPIPLVADTDCSAAYPAEITPNMRCAGDTTGPGSCSGDSGGPLMVTQASAPGWLQIGVDSWGDACRTPQKFEVYTRISSLREWIDDTIRGVNPHCPGHAP